MVVYPTNPTEWQIWIEGHLGISVDTGLSLVQSESFPIEELVDAWKDEFTVEKGYVTDFIPALVRNKKGLLLWVYLGESEPNWVGEDT